MLIELVLQILDRLAPVSTRDLARRALPQIHSPEHPARLVAIQLLIGARELRQRVAANQERDGREGLLGGPGRSCFADQTSRHIFR